MYSVVGEHVNMRLTPVEPGILYLSNLVLAKAGEGHPGVTTPKMSLLYCQTKLFRGKHFSSPRPKPHGRLKFVWSFVVRLFVVRPHT